MKKSVFYAVTLCLTAFAVIADELRVDYGSFYSHLKKIDQDDTRDLEFGFGFLHVSSKQLCHITNGFIHTQKSDIPIEIGEDNRFNLPTEKALKLAKAEVVLQLLEASNQCDMSVQIHSSQQVLNDHYTQQQLLSLRDQFSAFFDTMGSFLSFMMPSVNGVVLHLSNVEQSQKLLQRYPELRMQHDKVILTSDWIDSHSADLELGVRPIKMTALIE